ncbi:hypothetical protein N836_28860 [Leptolyngbya sp. Heron Island J]|uniref:hypothetical protein n=1 Tax=Leptolyngbya sp. Heron Island J TaxID=1385935 RepID=UPI0003B9AE93|nr:hypothetical protein [Leptolyngbya sp. Heron Island J]ESA39089.1 hypothetical protein N836_28860 [Leptolyngbya sp. Heron Island J]
MEHLATTLGRVFSEAIAPMGPPTSEQLELINQNRPLGREPYTADEIVSVPIIASNNLVNWSNGRWNKDALIKMAETYPGLPFAVDHPMYTVKNTVGFIYDVQLIESNAAPVDILEAAGELANNTAVVQAEGFIQMVCYAAIAADHPILDSIDMGRVNNASTTCITDGTSLCPLDGTKFGSQSRYRCAEGHYHPFYAWWYDVEDEDKVAPYAIKTGVISSVELSLVLMGNLPAASIPRGA